MRNKALSDVGTAFGSTAEKLVGLGGVLSVLCPLLFCGWGLSLFSLSYKVKSIGIRHTLVPGAVYAEVALRSSYLLIV